MYAAALKNEIAKCSASVRKAVAKVDLNTAYIITVSETANGTTTHTRITPSITLTFAGPANGTGTTVKVERAAAPALVNRQQEAKAEHDAWKNKQAANIASGMYRR
jgi:hypothetical protein